MRIIIIVISLLLICALTAAGQQSSSQTRAEQISSTFSKFKSVSKDKHGVKKEKYKDVRSETVVKQNIADYAGVYEVADLGYTITIQVGNDGSVRANGSDKGQQSSSFRLEEAKIEGGLLTAKKVYDNGTTEKFEGVFMMRTERNSPTDPGTTVFGLGVVLSTPRELDGLTYDKLFYQRR